METKLTKINQFDADTVSLIKNTVAVGATDEELRLFLYQASRAQLDPLARQIYFVKRAGKVTIQTSIDGFRLIAERSGKYAGQDEPVFEDKDGKPFKCSVAVYKFSETGLRYKATVGVAYWEEYCPAEGQNFMWKKMPRTMLSKVAEAKALRQAFPQDLSGLYTTEEINQEAEKDNKPESAASTPSVPMMNDYQRDQRIYKFGENAGMDRKATDEYVRDVLNNKWPEYEKITLKEANEIADALELKAKEEMDERQDDSGRYENTNEEESL